MADDDASILRMLIEALTLECYLDATAGCGNAARDDDGSPPDPVLPDPALPWLGAAE